MATIRSYTTIEQSKALAKILPLESADMYYDYNVQKHEHYPMIMDEQFDDFCILAWSLSALLGILPNGTDIVKAEADTKNEKYMCTVGVKGDIVSTFGNNPVDACYEMIMRLNELKML